MGNFLELLSIEVSHDKAEARDLVSRVLLRHGESGFVISCSANRIGEGVYRCCSRAKFYRDYTGDSSCFFCGRAHGASELVPSMLSGDGRAQMKSFLAGSPLEEAHRGEMGEQIYFAAHLLGQSREAHAKRVIRQLQEYYPTALPKPQPLDLTLLSDLRDSLKATGVHGLIHHRVEQRGEIRFSWRGLNLAYVQGQDYFYLLSPCHGRAYSDRNPSYRCSAKGCSHERRGLEAWAVDPREEESLGVLQGWVRKEGGMLERRLQAYELNEVLRQACALVELAHDWSLQTVMKAKAPVFTHWDYRGALDRMETLMADLGLQ